MQNTVKLKAEKIELCEKVDELTSEFAASSKKLNTAQTKISRFNKFVSMMIKQTDYQEGMLKAQQKSHDKTGIGYEKQELSGKNIFVPEIPQSIIQKSEIDQQDSCTKDTRICNYCEKVGHIQGKCLDFITKYIRQTSRTTLPNKKKIKGKTARQREPKQSQQDYEEYNN